MRLPGLIDRAAKRYLKLSSIILHSEYIRRNSDQIQLRGAQSQNALRLMYEQDDSEHEQDQDDSKHEQDDSEHEQEQERSMSRTELLKRWSIYASRTRLQRRPVFIPGVGENLVGRTKRCCWKKMLEGLEKTTPRPQSDSPNELLVLARPPRAGAILWLSPALGWVVLFDTLRLLLQTILPRAHPLSKSGLSHYSVVHILQVGTDIFDLHHRIQSLPSTKQA